MAHIPHHSFLCAKHFAKGGGGTLATIDGHPPPSPPLPFFRKPHRTSTQQYTGDRRPPPRSKNTQTRNTTPINRTRNNPQRKTHSQTRATHTSARRAKARTAQFSQPHASATHEHLAGTTRDKHTRNRFHHHHHTTIVLHTNTVIYTRHPRVRNNAKACNPRRLHLHANAAH